MPAPDPQFVTVLNDYSGTRVEQRERKSGKQHVTISVSAEPIAVFTDPIALGQGPAMAIAEVFRAAIAGIQEQASDGTKLARSYASQAFAAGKSWATKRYSGGRTGAKAPEQKTPEGRLFNDSGRLAEGITANLNRKEGGYTINAPVNRLDPSTFSSIGAFQRMIDRLFQLAPVLKNPLGDPRVQEAIEKTWTEMHRKGQMAAAEKQGQLIGRLVLEALKLAQQVLT